MQNNDTYRLMHRLLVILLLSALQGSAQNKSGYTWVFGAARAVTATFTDTSRPVVFPRFTNPPLYFDLGHSNICDSNTGKLLFSCNAMVMYDSNCNIMENGDSLVPQAIYTHNAFPSGINTQGSLILPKGNNGMYYVFIPTVSDTTYAKWSLPNAYKTPYDMLTYNVVDMNANGGLGKVILKAQPLLTNTEMSRPLMQACRHSNGQDWWLLKKTGIEQNIITRFLVTKDSIYGPYIQSFPAPDFSYYDATGQCCFNKSGDRFAMVQGLGRKLFLANFDRCTGELSDPKVFSIPIDSTTLPYVPIFDSLSNGVCFSPNDTFIYISRSYNIYQFEYNNNDSSQAWFSVKHGQDTTVLHFSNYNSLHVGPDNRIYIGNLAGQFKQMSVIDKPDIKGSGCQFCRKCLRLDDATNMGFASPPNIPDFNLGPLPGPCWPLEVENSIYKQTELEIYPNPAHDKIYIKTSSSCRRELINSLGQLIFSTTENEMSLNQLSKGLYFIKVGNQYKKIIVQ